MKIMNNKKYIFFLMGFFTLLAGVGVLSTSVVVFAGQTPYHSPQTSHQPPVSGGSITNTNTNTNTVHVGAGPVIAYAVQSDSYSYPPAYPYPPQQLPYSYQVSPGIPNAGVGDMGKINLSILILSGIFVLAGSRYLWKSAQVLS